MKFGVREICEVVLRAKNHMKVGNKEFFRNEPVILFDSLKTSSMEGATSTVYANGGRGNSRLIAWEGEKTVTFTMEDALISPEGLMILTGAGLIEASETETIKVHATERAKVASVSAEAVTIELTKAPYIGTGKDYCVYVMLTNSDDEWVTEPYCIGITAEDNVISIPAKNGETDVNDLTKFHEGDIVFVDYYVEKKSGVSQIEIAPDSFGGNFYLEAATLFRTTSGEDLPAEFIIPNCKVQSNFTFSMASTGDPSTFTFTMDAFPDYTRFNPDGKKVLAAIQVITADREDSSERAGTAHSKFSL